MMKKLLPVLAAIGTICGCTFNSELHETVTIDGSVGKLVGNVDRPAFKGDKCPTMIIFHGLTGFRTEDHLNIVADSLFAAGYAVVRFDFNGHGESEGKFVNMTLENELEDAEYIYDYVASLDWVDTERIGIAGHSQGGLIAGVLAGELGVEKISCAVLMAPAASIHAQAVKGHQMLLSEGKNLPDSLQLWGSQYYVGPEYILSAVYMDPLEAAGRYSGPACVIQGTADDPKLYEEACKYPEYMWDCRFERLEGYTHGFREDLTVLASLVLDFVNEKMPAGNSK